MGTVGRSARGAPRSRLLLGLAAVLTALGLALVGLAVTRDPDLPPSPPSSGATAGAPDGVPTAARTTDASPDAAPAPLPESRPTELSIPALGVRSPLMGLGRQADGSMEVPPGARPAGWYVLGPTPGQVGPALIAGHVTYNGVRGVFFSLARLSPGDRIDVRRHDGRIAQFRVDSVRRYPKRTFPTRAVYGDTSRPELRLITCGGDYDAVHHRYADNVVVFAHLTAET